MKINPRKLKVGDTVTQCPILLELGVWTPDGRKLNCKSMQGRVVWIHPQRRFYTVRFTFGRRSILECFSFT